MILLARLASPGTIGGSPHSTKVPFSLQGTRKVEQGRE